MRCIIAGGRDFDDATFFALGMRLCPWSDRITVVLSGACGLKEDVGLKRPPFANGADGLGERWADLRGIALERYYAKWKRGKKAGPERNRLMASLADALIYFPGDRGTASMVEAAMQYDLHIFDAEKVIGEVCGATAVPSPTSGSRGDDAA